MLEDLQAAAIRTDNLLFSFKKQHQGEKPQKTEPRPQQNYYQNQNANQSQNQQNPQNTDPNAMELDQLTVDEYW